MTHLTLARKTVHFTWVFVLNFSISIFPHFIMIIMIIINFSIPITFLGAIIQCADTVFDPLYISAALHLRGTCACLVFQIYLTYVKYTKEHN